MKKKQTDIKRILATLIFCLFISAVAVGGESPSKAIDEVAVNRAPVNRWKAGLSATPVILAILTTTNFLPKDIPIDIMTEDASPDVLERFRASDVIRKLIADSLTGSASSADAVAAATDTDSSDDSMEADASDDHFSWSEIESKKRFSIKAPIARIRSGPGVEHSVLWTAEKYYPVVVIDESETWYYFQDFEGDQGWIYKAILDQTLSVITRKNKCNIHSGPKKTDEILFTVQKGIPFKVLGHKGKWIQVEHADGDKGWLHQRCAW